MKTLNDLTKEELIELLEDAVKTLKVLYEDTEMALDERWDKSDAGFEDQQILIDMFLNKIQ